MTRAASFSVFFACFLVGACRGEPGAPPAVSGAGAVAPPESIALVESVPVETDLDHPDVPNAPDVWLAMIRGAARTIDLAELYAVSREGSALEEVVVELERALARGVRVRLVLDGLFFPKYPELAARLERAGAHVRRLELAKVTGGVLHAKYFVVDDREAFVGSQNFDWRALEHIQEMGVRLRDPDAVAALASLFDADFRGEARAAAIHAPAIRWGGRPEVRVMASPRGLLPDETAWDLPELVAWIDGAARSVDVQLLTYKPAFRDGKPFRDLDAALERAARRGVRVRLFVSHWAVRDPKDVAPLARLGALPNAQVHVVEIPAWSGGPLEFARVSHAKYMVVDGARAWVGTSNWEGDYFFQSSNVSVFSRAPALAQTLARVFEHGWSGRYARDISSAPPKGAPANAEKD